MSPNALSGSFNGKCLVETVATQQTTPDANPASSPSITLGTFQHTISGNLTLLPGLTADFSGQDDLAGTRSYLNLVLNEMEEYGRAGSPRKEWRLCKQPGYNMSEKAQTALLTRYSAICEWHLLLNSNARALASKEIISLSSSLADSELDTVQADYTCNTSSELMRNVSWRNRLAVTHNTLLQLKTLIKDSLPPCSSVHTHSQAVNKFRPKIYAQIVSQSTQPHVAMSLCPPQDPEGLNPSTSLTTQKVKGVLLRKRSTQEILLNFTLEPVAKSVEGRSEICIKDSRYCDNDEKACERVTLEEAYHWDMITHFKTADEMVKAFELSLQWLEPNLPLLTAGINTNNLSHMGLSVSTATTLVRGAAGFYQDTLQQLLDNLSLISCNHQAVFNRARQVWEQKGIDYKRYQHTKLIELLALDTSICQSWLLRRISKVLSKISTDPDASAKYTELAQFNKRNRVRLTNRRCKRVRTFTPHLLSDWRLLGFAVHAYGKRSRLEITCMLPIIIANNSL